MKHAIAALMLGFASLIAHADNWGLQSDRDGIAVFTADIPGQDLRAFRGVITLNAPMKSVVALLADTDNMPNWFYHMRSARVLAGPRNENYRYLVIAGVWPVSDRDVVIQVDAVQQADGSILMTAEAAADRMPVQSCCVRIPRMESSWLVRALGDGRTEVTFSTKSHPGGSLPLWVANLVATDMPRNTLKALRGEVRKPAYANVEQNAPPEIKEFLARFRF